MSALNDLVVRLLITGQDRTGPAVRSTRQGVASISTQLQALQSVATRFLDFKLFQGWAQESIALVDAYQNLTGRLRQVTSDTAELDRVQQDLFDLSQRTKTGLSDTTELYIRTSFALKNYADSQKKAAQLTEVVNLSFRAQSLSAVEISSTVTQLTQAIAGGAVQWEDFGNLADTNLLLVNTAAKNLGFDGIGALKKAMSEGKISGIQLTDALIDGFDEIKAAADTIPVSVEAAWTTLNNALLNYVGESQNANRATQMLSSGIQLLANNIDSLIQVAVILAKIYAVKVVSGLLASAHAQATNAQAARQATIAAQFQAQQQQNSLQIRARVLVIQQRVAAGLVEEARLQVAMAATEQQRAQAVSGLTAAIERYRLSVNRANAANATLSGGLNSTTQSVSRSERAMTALGGAMSVLLAYEVGTTFGQWLAHFEAVRVAGSYLAETFALIASGAEAMLDDTSLADRFEQIKKIHSDFNEVRANSTEQAVQSAERQSTAEKQKAKATEDSAERQKAAYIQIQAATAELTTLIEAQAKRQSTLFKQQLQDRLQAIDEANLSERQKQQLRFDLSLEFADKNIELQKSTQQEKLDLIDNEYATELERTKDNQQRVAQIETEKRQAKLSVYTGLASFYNAEVNRLRSVYADEISAARDSRDALANLAASHEKNLFNIKLGGLNKRDKLYEQEKRFNQLVAESSQEIAKGQQGDQDKINTLLADARDLHGKISSAAGKGSTAIYEAKKRENTLYDAQKTVLENNATAHEENAGRAKTALQKTKFELQQIQVTIDQITEQLGQALALIIEIDTSSLSTARAVINELTRPATKVITIVTQNAAQKAQKGGPIYGFNRGGFAPLSGKLPGFGGGDKVKALLEAGEFIIRKEAVQKLGLGFMQQVNAGKSPDQPIKRALGGAVQATRRDKDKEQAQSQSQLPQVVTSTALDSTQAAPKKTQEAASAGLSKLDLIKELQGLSGALKLVYASYASNYRKVESSRSLLTGGVRDLAAADALQRDKFEYESLNNDVKDIMSAFKKLGYKSSFSTFVDDNGRFKPFGFVNNRPIKFATGGLVPGSGNKDTVPAVLTPGEFILKKTAAQALGPDFLAALNNGMAPVQKFAAGGAVGGGNGGSVDKIEIIMKIGNASAVGSFDKSNQTQAFLDEMRQSGMVST